MKDRSIKNVVFIMLDSLQFNYLGCYGNQWIKTPNIDALAREGVLFENAYSEGLPTIPVRRAMMTGRYTLHAKGWGPLDRDDTTVADIMWGRGVHSALIYDSAPLRLLKYGYSRGFDEVHFLHGHEMDHYYYANDDLVHYNVDDFIEYSNYGDDNVDIKAIKPETESYLKAKQYWRSEADNYGPRLMKRAMKFIEERDKTHPFMLWVDSFDPHQPWDAPSIWAGEPCPYDPDWTGKANINPPNGGVKNYSEAELHHMRMLYAEKVTMMDRWVGKFLDKIREEGLMENTLIMLTADHGVPIGNGEHGHGIMHKCRPWPYEELVHIPMIIRMPGGPSGKRVKSFVQSCDVAPTLCDWLGVRKGASMTFGDWDLPVAGVEDMQGESLLPLVTGEKEKLRDFAIAGYYGYSWSIITEDYTYIHWLQNSHDSENWNTDQTQGFYSDFYQFKEDALDEDKLGSNAHPQAQEMWSCSPSANVTCPDIDGFYDRRADPFQLNNIIKERPEKAKELFDKLRLFMGELKTM